MKRGLLAILCLFSVIFSFLYFLPADVFLSNLLASSGAEFSSIDGNGWYIKIPELTFKGVSVSDIECINRVISINIVSGNSSIKVYPVSKRAVFSIKGLPFSVNAGDFKGEGTVYVNGFVRDNLSGDVSGKIHVENALYKGVNAGKLNVQFSYKDGEFSADFTSSFVKGRATGNVSKKGGDFVISGIVNLFIEGEGLSKRFKYVVAGLSL
ncbi:MULTISPECIES: hypothetical protein [unclassified Desulfurobacterium]|uniref:hypothetical protein n=1 Tax=Desulfurobacterium sp. TC5-1 TaxID=1158318 RepID=UPI0003B76F5B|nr:hypothetical protein [Desulfurobacterium sp. TC5-1]